MEFELDPKDMLCVVLRRNGRRHLSPTRIQFICDYLNLDFEFIFELSKEYERLFIFKGNSYTDNRSCIAFAKYPERSNEIYRYSCWSPFCDVPKEVQEKIYQMSPTPIPATPKPHKVKKEPVKLAIKLDLDSILDKINKTGLKSLDKSEIIFLESYK